MHHEKVKLGMNIGCIAPKYNFIITTRESLGKIQRINIL